MRKRLLALVLSVFMLANAGLSVTASTTSNANTRNGVSANLQDLGENYGNSAAKRQQYANEEKQFDEPDFAAGDIVRVSIVVEGKSTLEEGYSTANIAKNKKAVSYRNSLQKKQNSIEAAIEKKGISVNVKWNLTLAANIISAEVAYGDIEAIKSIAGVKDVFLENRYDPCDADDVNTAVTTSEMIFAQSAWAAGYTGAGSLVAIIDTGTNHNHISFAADALEYSLTKDGKTLGDYDLLTKEDISTVRSQLNKNVNVDSVYKNLKIPYAYNYIDGNYTTDHGSDSQGEHGSHVSGIAAANRYVKVNGEYVEAAGTYSAVGVAPDAQIITMKVFGKGGGAYDSDYMAAIEDAIVLGADSANLSLGSSAAGFSFSDNYQSIMNSLVRNNTVVVMSAGNNYSWNHFTPNTELYDDDVNFSTGGSPGSFINSLGIASADNIGGTGNPLIFNGTQKVMYTESTGYKNPPISNYAGSYEYVYIDGVGSTTEYQTVNAQIPLSGKVVMVNRGTLSFYEKGDNCYSYRPVGVVVVNNQDGVINMDLSSLVNAIPMVSMTLDDGIVLKQNSTVQTIGAYTVYTGRVEITDTLQAVANVTADKAQISDFSSWGTAGGLLIKPELTAPGGNIWSVNGMTNDSYETMSGTSMAAPHTTGMAAVLGQYIRENDLEDKLGMTKRQITNALLMSTATPLHEKSSNYQNYISVMGQGAGLGNVFNATQAKSIITVGADATVSYADGKVKAELGENAARDGKYEYTFYIKNFSEEDITYELSSDMFTQKLENGYLLTKTAPLNATVTYSTGSSVTVAAGEKKEVEVTIQLNDIEALNAAYPKGCYVEGYTYIKASGDGEGVVADVPYSIPVLGFHGSWTDPSMFDAVKALEKSYGKGHTSAYFNANTNAVTIRYQGETAATNFLGNMYMAEPEIPYERFAINSQAYINNVSYLLIRAASAVAAFTSKINEDGTRSNVTVSSISNIVSNPYYDQSNSRWSGNSATSKSISKTVGDLGFAEGDRIDFGVVAIPEYYALKLNQYSTNRLTSAQIQSLLATNNLGEGAFIHYPMTIDNTAPVIESVVYDEQAKTVTVVVQDNQYVAYLAIRKMDGSTVIAECVPDQSAPNQKITKVFDVSNVEIGNAINVFVADYAMNETNTLAILADGPIEQEVDAYVLATSFTNNSVYVIADGTSNGPVCDVNKDGKTDKDDAQAILDIMTGVAASMSKDYDTAAADYDGDGKVTSRDAQKLLKDLKGEIAIPGHVLRMASTSSNAVTTAGDVTIHYDSKNGAYILASDVTTSDTWTYQSGSSWGSSYQRLRNNGTTSTRYLRVYNNNVVTGSSASNVSYDASAMLLKQGSNGIVYNATNNRFVPEANSTKHSYIYVKGKVTVQIDPTVATKVTVSPSTATLYGAGDSVQLTATVDPSYLQNKSVVWTSADPTVATVDEEGKVTSVAGGTVKVRATSVATDTVYGEATITVVPNNPVNAVVDAVVNCNDGPFYVSLDLNDMSMSNRVAIGSYLYGGGRNGRYLLGYTAEDVLQKLDIADNCVVVAQDALGDSLYDPVDGAAFPAIPYEGGEEAYELVYPIPDAQWIILYTGDFMESPGFNLSSNNLGFVAMCYVGSFIDDDNLINNAYYALRDNNSIWELDFHATVDEETGEPSLGLSGGTINNLTGFSVNSNAKDAYSMTVTNDGLVIIADRTNNFVYSVKLNPSTTNQVTSVAASYVGTVDGMVSCLSNTEFDSGRSNASINIKKNAEVNAVLSTEKFEAKESVEVPAVKVAAPVADAEIESLTPSVANNSITFAAEDVDNGYVEISYDNTEVSYDGYYTSATFQSCYIDNGVIKFAFAYEDTYTGDVATFDFHNDNCNDGNVTVAVKELNDNLDCTDSEQIKITGLGHDYKFKEFEWAEDYSSAKAVYVCTRDSEHVVKYDAEVTSEVTTAPTCEDKGVRTYTATYKESDAVIRTDTKTEEIAATDHDYKFIRFVWNPDYTADALYVCANNMEHQVTYAATVTSEVTKEPTCEDAGVRTYTATYDGHSDTKTEEIPAIKHNYQFKEFEWAEDYSSAKAVYVCANDAEHVVKYDATVTSDITTAPTCEGKGERTYYASYDKYIDSKTEEVDPIGHDYQFKGMEWSEDHKSAMANFVCSHDPEHNFQLPAEIDDQVVVEPNENEEGLRVVIATVVFDDVEYKETYEEVLPKVVPTGDRSNAKLWLSLSAVAAAGGAVVLLKKRED